MSITKEQIKEAVKVGIASYSGGSATAPIFISVPAHHYLESFAGHIANDVLRVIRKSNQYREVKIEEGEVTS